MSKNAQSLLKTSTNHLSDTVGSAIHSGRNVLNSTVQNTGNFAHGIVDKTQNIVTNTTKNVGNLASNTVRRVGDTVGRAAVDLGNIGADAIDTVHGFATDTIDGVGHVTKSAISSTRNISTNVIDSTNNVSQNILNSGKQIVGHADNNIDDLFVEGDTFLGNLLRNSAISYGIKIILLIYIAFFASNLSQASAMLMDSTFVRVIIAALIIIFASHDPIISLLIVISFLISLQTANRYKIEETSKKINSEAFRIEHYNNMIQPEHMNITHPEEHTDHQQSVQPEHQVMPLAKNKECKEGSCGYNTSCGNIGNPTLPNCNMDRETQVFNGQSPQEPMSILQNNTVPGVNQSGCVQSYKNQMCAQGLNCPQGSNMDSLDDQFAPLHNNNEIKN